RKNTFFSRFQRPGLDRLLACHVDCHLMRAIGHHIDRLACRSVTIMGCLSTCLSENALERPCKQGATIPATADYAACRHPGRGNRGGTRDLNVCAPTLMRVAVIWNFVVKRSVPTKRSGLVGTGARARPCPTLPIGNPLWSF